MPSRAFSLFFSLKDSRASLYSFSCRQSELSYLGRRKLAQNRNRSICYTFFWQLWPRGRFNSLFAMYNILLKYNRNIYPQKDQSYIKKSVSSSPAWNLDMSSLGISSSSLISSVDSLPLLRILLPMFLIFHHRLKLVQEFLYLAAKFPQNPRTSTSFVSSPHAISCLAEKAREYIPKCSPRLPASCWKGFKKSKDKTSKEWELLALFHLKLRCC